VGNKCALINALLVIRSGQPFARCFTADAGKLRKLFGLIDDFLFLFNILEPQANRPSLKPSQEVPMTLHIPSRARYSPPCILCYDTLASSQIRAMRP
jgi:hypothetical protein